MDKDKFYKEIEQTQIKIILADFFDWLWGAPDEAKIWEP